jgi:hypothetical protein
MIFVMNNKTFNVRSILAGEAPKDAAITVKGWVRTRRDAPPGVGTPNNSEKQWNCIVI